VVRMVPARVEVKRKGNLKDTLGPQAFRWDVYREEAMQLLLGIDQEQNAVLVGAVPGNYDATRGLCALGGRGRVAAIREADKGKGGSPGSHTGLPRS
jgi:hypothetical protein